MVWLHRRDGRRRLRGKLLGHPAITSAAVASHFGIDPLTFLALAEDDQRIMNAVITERAEIDAEQRHGELDYLASKTASLTVEHMTRWLAKNLPKLHG